MSFVAEAIERRWRGVLRVQDVAGRRLHDDRRARLQRGRAGLRRRRGGRAGASHAASTAPSAARSRSPAILSCWPGRSRRGSTLGLSSSSSTTVSFALRAIEATVSPGVHHHALGLRALLGGLVVAGRARLAVLAPAGGHDGEPPDDEREQESRQRPADDPWRLQHRLTRIRATRSTSPRAARRASARALTASDQASARRRSASARAASRGLPPPACLVRARDRARGADEAAGAAGGERGREILDAPALRADARQQERRARHELARAREMRGLGRADDGADLREAVARARRAARRSRASRSQTRPPPASSRSSRSAAPGFDVRTSTKMPAAPRARPRRTARARRRRAAGSR